MRHPEDHPAVMAAMALLEDDNPVLTVVLERDAVVAVVAESATTRWHVIVENIDGRWEPPTLVSGNVRTTGTPRQVRTGSPPILGEFQLTRSGRPGPDGGPPATSWCVMTGRAATDAEVVVVDTGLDVQRCAVAGDGFVSVLVLGLWARQPDLSVETTGGDVVTLFNG